MVVRRFRQVFIQIFIEDIRTKLYRYCYVSIFNIVVTQLFLWFFDLWTSSIVANLISVSLASVPAFFLYKKCVWKHNKTADLHKEILIFWLVALVGLVFSTFTVWLATRWWDGFLSVALGNIFGFTIIWIGKFILLETYLFAHKKNQPE